LSSVGHILIEMDKDITVVFSEHSRTDETYGKENEFAGIKIV